MHGRPGRADLVEEANVFWNPAITYVVLKLLFAVEPEIFVTACITAYLGGDRGVKLRKCS
jgi:hypothetical protein